MEQEIRLSRNQARKVRRLATKELQKGEKQQEKSSLSSRGKVMVGVIDNEESKQVIPSILQQQLDQLKSLVSRYNEIIFNQSEEIRELMNNIEDQNNQLLILSKQLADRRTVINAVSTKLQIQSKNGKRKKSNITRKIRKKEEEHEEGRLLKRIKKLEKQIYYRKTTQYQFKKC